LSYDNSSYIFLDACFISRLRQVDKTCGLIDFFGPCAGARCVIKMNQYRVTPCNNFVCECEDLDNMLSDEKSVIFQRQAEALGIEFSKISRDPNDIKIFIWGYHTDNAAIWTTDGKLLLLCRQNDVPRNCFKAALKALDTWLGGAITCDDSYTTEIMKEGDDPFFHYSTTDRCATYCGLEDTCICHYH